MAEKIKGKAKEILEKPVSETAAEIAEPVAVIAFSAIAGVITTRILTWLGNIALKHAANNMYVGTIFIGGK